MATSKKKPQSGSWFHEGKYMYPITKVWTYAGKIRFSYDKDKKRLSTLTLEDLMGDKE
jgi:hypothetical protein